MTDKELEALLASMSPNSRKVTKTLIDRHLVGNHLANLENAYTAGQLLLSVRKSEGEDELKKIDVYVTSVSGDSATKRWLRLVECWKLSELQTMIKQSASGSKFAVFAGLCVSHFFLVCSMEPEQRQQWLKRAIDGRWSVDKLRNEINTADIEMVLRADSTCGRRISLPRRIASGHEKVIKNVRFTWKLLGAFGLQREHHSVDPALGIDELRIREALNHKQRDAEVALVDRARKDIARLAAEAEELREAIKAAEAAELAKRCKKTPKKKDEE